MSCKIIVIAVCVATIATQSLLVVISGFSFPPLRTHQRALPQRHPYYRLQLQQQQQQQPQEKRDETLQRRQQQHPTTVLHSSSSDTTLTSTEPLTLDGRKINGPVVPLNNFVLVRVAKAIEATTGGIFLAGKAKQVKTEGTVIAVGPGKTHPDSGITIPIPVSVGMNVVYGKYDGTEIDYNGEKHTLIRDDDILITYTSETLDSLDTVEVVRDNILVYVEEKEVTTEGGILIAKSSKSESKPSIGLVMKIGPGKMAANGEIISITKPTNTDTTDMTLLQIGDYIKFRDYAGNEVTIDGKEYTVVKMADVLAKF
jgi:chaperonin GroES